MFARTRSACPEPVSDETVKYIVLYGSPEYLGVPTNSPDGQFAPPPWKQPLEKVRQTLIAKTATWRTVTNYEASQPPLYYTLAGAWWRLGKWCGFHDGFLLYWLRFLNVFFVAVLVWLGFVAARMVFPGKPVFAARRAGVDRVHAADGILLDPK